jgi:hypothetical protein
LPFCDGLFDPFGFGYLLAEDLEEGGLAAADVAFNGVAEVGLGEFGVEGGVVNILIEASR